MGIVRLGVEDEGNDELGDTVKECRYRHRC